MPSSPEEEAQPPRPASPKFLAGLNLSYLLSSSPESAESDSEPSSRSSSVSDSARSGPKAADDSRRRRTRAAAAADATAPATPAAASKVTAARPAVAKKLPSSVTGHSGHGLRTPPQPALAIASPPLLLNGQLQQQYFFGSFIPTFSPPQQQDAFGASFTTYAGSPFPLPFQPPLPAPTPLELKLSALESRLAWLQEQDSLALRAANMDANTPVHVFVDLSNITINFFEMHKAVRGLPAGAKLKDTRFSFDIFAAVAERGRNVVVRALAGSVAAAAASTSSTNGTPSMGTSPGKRPQFMMDAERLGYEMNILVRVPRQPPPPPNLPEVAEGGKEGDRQQQNDADLSRSLSSAASPLGRSAGSVRRRRADSRRSKQLSGNFTGFQPLNFNNGNFVGNGAGGGGEQTPFPGGVDWTSTDTGTDDDATAYAPSGDKRFGRGYIYDAVNNTWVPDKEPARQSSSDANNNGGGGRRNNNNNSRNQQQRQYGNNSNNNSAEAAYREQGVDEVLHLKMADSILDHPGAPGVMVVATGDAAGAEYSDGFQRHVERALKAGWLVELVAWGKGLSGAWTSGEFAEMWGGKGGRFRIIRLDPFLMDMLEGWSGTR